MEKKENLLSSKKEFHDGLKECYEFKGKGFLMIGRFKDHRL